MKEHLTKFKSKTEKFVHEDSLYISPSYTRIYPLVAVKGKGAEITDIDGKKYLDFTAGIAAASTGHCHPEVVKAIKKQSENLIHFSGTDFYYPSQLNLAKKLAALFNDRTARKAFFSNSGTEAVEAAFKLARYHTGRKNIIAFYGAFHGRTLGSLSLSASKSIHKKRFSPLVPGVFHTPYAYCYRCPFNLKHPDCNTYCVDHIRENLFQKTVPPDEVAAVIVEPIQGEGGVIAPPYEFHQKLSRLCADNGILLIADEVQTGLGRTGRMFAMEHFGVIPDIVCLAKGIASGLPLGATVAPSKIMDWEAGTHASTFGGNPVACEAALVTLELINKKLIKNAEATGNYLIDRLTALKERFHFIGDVRGKGLMAGIEIINQKTGKPDPVSKKSVINDCFKNGLLTLGAGESVVRFLPPLIITKKDVDRALAILEKTLKRTSGGKYG